MSTQEATHIKLILGSDGSEIDIPVEQVVAAYGNYDECVASHAVVCIDGKMINAQAPDGDQERNVWSALNTDAFVRFYDDEGFVRIIGKKYALGACFDQHRGNDYVAFFYGVNDATSDVVMDALRAFEKRDPLPEGMGVTYECIEGANTARLIGSMGTELVFSRAFSEHSLEVAR